MKATARRTGSDTFTHRVRMRGHEVTIDEPREDGGEDAGATPQELLAASLATCTAITLEMYARRKGWELGELSVECEYTPAERGRPTSFELAVRIPVSCTAEQRERLERIATMCPVHRTLEGAVTFSQRIEFA